MLYVWRKLKDMKLDVTKDERIAQIQLRIQELNNELIELDEEMRKLTYDKKEN